MSSSIISTPENCSFITRFNRAGLISKKSALEADGAIGVQIKSLLLALVKSHNLVFSGLLILASLKQATGQFEITTRCRNVIFLGFWFLTASKTKLKQEQKQSKEIGTERLPFPVASKIPGNGARKGLDDYELVNPKRKVMMSTSASFPWIIYPRLSNQ